MANTNVFFSNLKSGRCSSVVEARLLRFWEARNVKRGGGLMWMDLLLVDVNGTMMEVTVSASRLPQYRERVMAGAMVSISGFEVCRSSQNFRLTDSSLMIRFNEGTSFVEIDEPVSSLPTEAFRLCNQSELIGQANTNTQLPDIIGEILGVKSTVRDPPEEKNRVMVTMKLDSDETVTLSLFSAQDGSFHSMNVDPNVMIATSINPKMVGGWLFLSATSGTRPILSVGHKRHRITVSRSVVEVICEDRDITIAELSSFTVSASSQEIDFCAPGKYSE